MVTKPGRFCRYSSLTPQPMAVSWLPAPCVPWYSPSYLGQLTVTGPLIVEYVTAWARSACAVMAASASTDGTGKVGFCTPAPETTKGAAPVSTSVGPDVCFQPNE